MNVQQQRQNATEEFYFLHPNHRIYLYRRSKKPFLFQVRTVPVLFIPGYQVPVPFVSLFNPRMYYKILHPKNN